MCATAFRWPKVELKEDGTLDTAKPSRLTAEVYPQRGHLPQFSESLGR